MTKGRAQFIGVSSWPGHTDCVLLTTSLVTWSLLMPVAIQQTAAPSSSVVRGVVRDQTGAVLRGAAVELATDVGRTVATTTTDASGGFQIAIPEAGKYILHVSFEGFRQSTTQIQFAGRRPPPLQTVVLDLAAVLALGVDFFNITNRVNYSSFVGNLNSPFFGQAISSQPARRVQFSAEFHF